MSRSKSNLPDDKKPLFSLPLLFAIAIVAIVSAVGGYYYALPAPPPEAAKDNPNVIKVGQPVEKKDWKPYELNDIQKYTEKHIFPYIKKNQGPIKNCYFGYRGKEKLPEKGGKVTVEFTIQPDGSVKDPNLFASEVKIHDIESCILKAVSSWKLPPHSLSAPFKHQAPFFFR